MKLLILKGLQLVANRLNNCYLQDGIMQDIIATLSEEEAVQFWTWLE